MALVAAGVPAALLRQIGGVAFAPVLVRAYEATSVRKGAGAPVTVGALAAGAAAVAVTAALAIRDGASLQPVTR